MRVGWVSTRRRDCYKPLFFGKSPTYLIVVDNHRVFSRSHAPHGNQANKMIRWEGPAGNNFFTYRRSENEEMDLVSLGRDCGHCFHVSTRHGDNLICA